ncbi:prepilin-type N-terminal cleavage/methylation domain-containing protein [Azoarcus indigens]|uniref:General secretion pathway protein I n=1 Tax=Azoarcus indigens TaxID=29545 RepID=A0A4R6DWF3_9RHOO|nr:prepilin-type N-terminal cleavage/methylation domain-containing protein [Azoarcus indigens]NMG65136.1 prepilin-type N-terminal cleavage/methylation domain-containing protein [Azoarcus indigens]TDN49605.1 general secretion pathway protein I [Azoarcus indigens]
MRPLLRCHLLPARPTAAGFSLMEVLVALAIMAFSLAALYHAAGGSVRGVHTGETRTRALALALSLLDSRSTIPAGGLDESGSDAGLRWHLSARPYPTGHEASPGWPLYRVEAAVAWGEGRRGQALSLVSLLPERRAALERAE